MKEGAVSRVIERLSEGHERPPSPPRPAKNAPAWMWFLAVFGIVVFAGGAILYTTSRSGPTAVDASVADAETDVDEDPSAHPVDTEPADGMATPMPGAAPIAPADEVEGEHVAPGPDVVEGKQVPQGPEVVEIEMVEFGYAPARINLQAGVPVVLRFANSGRLAHEAMIGDAHMQEEFAAAGDHDDAAEGDHHGDVMAVMVGPGETRDLEVVIDEPGTWYMACHLPGHYERGQIATINVI